MLAPVFASLRAGRRSGRFTYSREDAAADLLVGPVAAAMLRVIDNRVDERHDTAVASLILRGIGISTREADAIARRPLPAVSELEQPEAGTTGRSPRRRT
jgi:hypothetical protein